MTEIAAKLKSYAALVRAWSPKLDLVSTSDIERFEERHVEDSLRLLDLISSLIAGPCIDVGSGAGLPGVPLAIASGRHWRLLEPRQRRGAFLEEVVRELDLDCEVLTMTAEAAAQDARLAKAHALATARALAPPERAFALITPLVTARGIAAVFIGEDAEIPAGAEAWAPGIATMVMEPDDMEGTS